MKIKTRTPDGVVVSLNRRETIILANCLKEACHGLTMDRFLPAHQDLLLVLRDVNSILERHEYFRLKPVAA